MSTVRSATICTVLAAAAMSLAACGSSGTKLGSPNTTTTTAAPPPTTTTAIKNPLTIGANYHPKIDPETFSNRITNRYFPLVAGKTLH